MRKPYLSHEVHPPTADNIGVFIGLSIEFVDECEFSYEEGAGVTVHAYDWDVNGTDCPAINSTAVVSNVTVADIDRLQKDLDAEYARVSEKLREIRNKLRKQIASERKNKRQNKV